MLVEPFWVTAPSRMVVGYLEIIANGAHTSGSSRLFHTYSCWQRCSEQICFLCRSELFKPRSYFSLLPTALWMFRDIGNGVAVSVTAIFDWIHLAVQYLYRLVGLFRPTYMYPDNSGPTTTNFQLLSADTHTQLFWVLSRKTCLFAFCKRGMGIGTFFIHVASTYRSHLRLWGTKSIINIRKT